MKIAMSVILVCAGIYLTTVYFVNTRSGLKVYPKKEYSLINTYVDLRNVGLCDLRAYSDIVDIMIESGDANCLIGGEYLDLVTKIGTAMNSDVEPFAIVDRACSLYVLADKAKKIKYKKSIRSMIEKSKFVKNKITNFIHDHTNN